ncbi:MAG: hypothetical protein IPK60_09475 [Sandaracinaceae bacterium]|jgi:hypothetical protein|nr:hypothetical protein [Sandaracinaceae bacterium]
MRLTKRASWFGLVLLCGCASTVTEIAVAVDTDLAIPGELDQITLRVDGADGLTATSVTNLDPAALNLPLKLRVSTQADDLNGPVVFTATGLVSDGAETDPMKVAVVATIVRTHFVEGKSVLLRMLLTRACIGTTCPDGQTCSEGSCIDATVDSTMLPPFTGLLPPPLVPRNDGGVDAGEGDVADADLDDGEVAPMDASVF